MLVDPFVPANAPTVLETASLADGVLFVRRQGLTQTGYARADGDIPDAVRRALRQAVEARRALAETEQRIAELQRERREIEREQARIRGNLQSIDNGSDYGRRLLAKLNQQESELEALDARIDQQRERADRERQALTVTVR